MRERNFRGTREKDKGQCGKEEKNSMGLWGENGEQTELEMFRLPLWNSIYTILDQINQIKLLKTPTVVPPCG